MRGLILQKDTHDARSLHLITNHPCALVHGRRLGTITSNKGKEETNMNYELIELTINFENKESECMIVSLDSTAHKLVRDYVEANGYELIEKPIEEKLA